MFRYFDLLCICFITGRWYIICDVFLHILKAYTMAKNKMKEKVIDTEPIKDDREEVAEAAQEMVEEQTGDKVTKSEAKRS